MLKNRNGDVAILFSLGVSVVMLGFIAVLQMIASNKVRLNISSIQSLESFAPNEVRAWHGYMKKKAIDDGTYREPASDATVLQSSSYSLVSGSAFCGISSRGANGSVCLQESGAGAIGSGTWSPLPDSGNLIGLHAPMTWTGKNIAIWGGFNGSYLGTGAFFDPLTNVYTAIPKTGNSPSVEFEYSLVWTGTKLIVWSGCTDSNGAASCLDSRALQPHGGGGIYDPISKTWETIDQKPNTPTIMFSHLATWTGDRALFWSADNGQGALLNPDNKTWTLTPKIPCGPEYVCDKPRYNGAYIGSVSVATGTQMIVWGGAGPNKAGELISTQDGAIYDYQKNSWIPLLHGPDTLSARIAASAVWTGKKVIIWGGTSNINKAEPLNTGAIYDPKNNTWKAMSTKNAPKGRMYGVVVWTGKQMLVWGGNTIDSDGNYKAAQDGATYDPETDSWTRLSKNLSAPTSGWTWDRRAIWGGNRLVVLGWDKMGIFDLKLK